MEAKVDYQVAAPAELRTPNLHRANHRSQKSADGRMAAEAEGLPIRPLDGNDKTRLTLTGLLMEGLGQLARDNPGCLLSFTTSYDITSSDSVHPIGALFSACFSLDCRVGEIWRKQLRTTFTKAGGVANSRWPSIAVIVSSATTAEGSSWVPSCDVANGAVRTETEAKQ